MPVVPGFPTDVFISYAHVDNTIPAAETRGWVTDLAELLNDGLVRKAGRADRIKVWFDPALRTNDVFDDRIREVLEGSVVFLAVLSHGYMASTYSVGTELPYFESAAARRLPIEIEGQSRMSAVVIDDLSREQWPAALQRSDGVRFTERNQNTGRMRLLRKPGSWDRERPYWDTVEKLVEDTWDLLQKVAKSRQEPQRATVSERCVFLADVSADLVEVREQLQRNLQQQHLEVYQLANSDRIEAQVDAETSRLAKSSWLSVHLLGRDPSQIAVRQCEIVSAGTNLRPYPIVWVPPEIDIANVRDAAYREFLAGLVNSDHNRPIKLLRTDLEDLKTEILTRAGLPPQILKPAVRPKNRKQPSIYISYRDDTESFSPTFAGYFEQMGCAVSLMNHAAAPDARRHKKWLQLSDLLLVLYGARSRPWAEDTVLEAREYSNRKGRPKAVGIAEVPRSEMSFNVRAANITPLVLERGIVNGAETFLAACDE